MIKMSDPTISDKSHFKISLPMAIQAIGAIMVLVYGYRELESRIRLNELHIETTMQTVGDLVELQEKPIPSDIRQDTRLNYLEAQMNNNNDDLEYLKRKLYGE
jgi:hypothetical protein